MKSTGLKSIPAYLSCTHRIYRASQTEDYKLVHKLQKLMVKSWYSKLLAVRKVTQDNRGKKTAGVDGIKTVPPSKRLGLVNHLSIDGNANPTRRVWIPKPGKKEMRPLGIPTMLDRAKQALLKMAIEPEWEAKFEPNSFLRNEVSILSSRKNMVVSQPPTRLMLLAGVRAN